MNRLFGKSKKQPVNQAQEQPDNSGEEDSGFTAIAAPEQPAIVTNSNSSTSPYGYQPPAVPNSSVQTKTLLYPRTF